MAILNNQRVMCIFHGNLSPTESDLEIPPNQIAGTKFGNAYWLWIYKHGMVIFTKNTKVPWNTIQGKAHLAGYYMYIRYFL